MGNLVGDFTKKLVTRMDGAHKSLFIYRSSNFYITQINCSPEMFFASAAKKSKHGCF